MHLDRLLFLLKLWSLTLVLNQNDLFKTELQRHFKSPLNFGFKPSFGLKPKLRTSF